MTIGDSSDDSCLFSTGAASVSASAASAHSNTATIAGAGSTLSCVHSFPTHKPRILMRSPSTTPGSTTGSEILWIMRDLQAFNIKITAEHDIQTFFGVSELPVPQDISPVIWNGVRAPAGPLSKTEKTFFAYI